jgi:hypothetical protein
MGYAEHRFDVRFIVFSPEDVHAGLKMIENQLKSADIDFGDSGIVSLKYERAARWTVSPFDKESGLPLDYPKKDPHLEPLMFNLTCTFVDRAFLREALGGVHRFFDMQLNGEPLREGLRGDVPDFQASAPCGEWQLTRVRLEPPQFYDSQTIWDY